MKRRRMGVAVAVVASAVAGGCGGTDPGPVAGEQIQGAPVVADLEGRVRLAPGETARLAGGTVFLTFLGVEGDSRCPIDAVCVHEGNAGVEVRVRAGSGPSRTLVMGTHQEPRQVEAGGMVVVLETLEPAPRAAEATPAGDYRASFRLLRR
jgi:hypothetical protein